MTETLFADLPEQRAPRVLTMGDHYLIPCGACGGTGEGALVWPDIVQPCRDCNGAGHLLGKLSGTGGSDR